MPHALGRGLSVACWTLRWMGSPLTAPIALNGPAHLPVVPFVPGSASDSLGLPSVPGAPHERHTVCAQHAPLWPFTGIIIT